MKQIIAFALIAACLVSATTKMPQSHFVDTKTVLAELDKDPFGNTIISAIALSVATKGPLDEVVLVINQILTELQNAQASADAQNKTNQALCDETLSGFRKQINDLTENIASAERAITENQDILTNGKTDLAQAERDYDETVTAIQQGTQQRAEEHSKWAENDYQQSIQIATLEEGVKLIQHMIHGVAFSQIKARYDKVLEKLAEQSSASNRATLFKPLITQLTQLANKLNYENVLKILDLLNNIRASIVEEQAQSKLYEEKAQQDWTDLLNQLENQKQSLSDKKQRLNNLISSTEDLLNQLKASLENYRTELENVQASLVGQTTWCDNESNGYQTESAERAREQDILQRLLAHIEEKFNAVADYVANRG